MALFVLWSLSVVTSAHSETITTARQKRLLLVADPNFSRTLARILSRSGYGVDVSESGEEALGRMSSTSYDLVISQLFPTGAICGVALFERIRSEHPYLPVIFLSEGDNAHFRQVVSHRNHVACVPVPVDVDCLKQVIAANTAA